MSVFFTCDFVYFNFQLYKILVMIYSLILTTNISTSTNQKNN